MKKATAVVLGILFAGAIVLGLITSSAVAGRGRHHHHHGRYWGYGPGVIVGGSPVVVDEECRMVERCWKNPWGEKRCQWVRECY